MQRPHPPKRGGPPPPAGPPPPRPSGTSSSSPAPATSSTSVSASASSKPSNPNTHTNNSASYFSEKDLPSVKSGHLTPEKERETRRKTCRFLEEASRILKLPRLATSTSMLFLHRFYAVHSFEDHDRFEVAVACLLLAAKTEESPKKLVVVIKQCLRLKMLSAKRGNGNGQKSEADILDEKSAEFVRLKERTLLLERVILHTIGFELSIDHPYKYVVEQVGKLKEKKLIEQIKSPPTSSSNPPPPPQPPKTQPNKRDDMTNRITQNAINLVNDSMHTCLCLQFPPKIIGLTCIYMSAQLINGGSSSSNGGMRIRPTDGRKWIDILNNGSVTNSDDNGGIDMESLTTIAMQIIELIADKKGVDKLIFKAIEADLAKMRKEQFGGGGDRDVKRQRLS